MEKKFRQDYRNLYENHWWWRAREKYVLKKLDSILGTLTENRILDVGCGDGLLLPKLKKYGICEGIEIDPDIVSSSTLHSEKIYIGPMDGSFNPGYKYDAVLLLDILEHLPDEKMVLKRSHEILRPGGILIVTVPALKSLWTHHDVINHHLRRYTKKNLATILSEANFYIKQIHNFFFWTVPVKLMIKIKEMVFYTGSRTVSIPPGFLNTLFFSISVFEQGFFKVLPPPTGSSLFAYCRKV